MGDFHNEASKGDKNESDAPKKAVFLKRLMTGGAVVESPAGTPEGAPVRLLLNRVWRRHKDERQMLTCLEA